jgi:hypothetical protein
MTRVGFEPRIPVFERAVTVSACLPACLTPHPPFTLQENSWYSFLLEAESTPVTVRLEGLANYQNFSISEQKYYKTT